MGAFLSFLSILSLATYWISKSNNPYLIYYFKMQKETRDKVYSYKASLDSTRLFYLKHNNVWHWTPYDPMSPYEITEVVW